MVPKEFIFPDESTKYPAGESWMLNVYGFWIHLLWKGAAQRYSYASNLWEPRQNYEQQNIARFSYTQMMRNLPSEISYDGAQRALMSIVPSMPIPEASSEVMNGLIEEALWWGMKPNAQIVQSAYWHTFTQFTPHSQVQKVLPLLSSATHHA